MSRWSETSGPRGVVPSDGGGQLGFIDVAAVEYVERQGAAQLRAVPIEVPIRTFQRMRWLTMMGSRPCVGVATSGIGISIVVTTSVSEGSDITRKEYG